MDAKVHKNKHEEEEILSASLEIQIILYIL